MAKPKILIVDDERPTRDVMARALSDKYECLTAADAEQAMKAVEENGDLALVISDVRMPGEDGVSLIRRAKAANPSLACMLLTAYGTVDLAVEAMKDGADDFLTKPITDLDQLELRVAKAIKTAGLEREVASLKEQLAGELESFTGKSPAMVHVYQMIRKVAPTNANVLIEGPSGSGKELAAKAIHNLSRRSKGPFIALECSAFEGDLLRSELFGYVAGTFTGALKEGCFWTRSAKSTWPRRSPFCGRSRRERCAGWATQWSGLSTSGSSRRQTAISPRWSPRANSGKTSTTGSTS